VTPAELPLSPGNYQVRVEKDGRQASRDIEIRNGVINYLKLSLE
jgi:hypothetical protein